MGDVGAPVGERGNVQTRGGDRVSTINLLGCSTSVVLATGPTDEEEFTRRNVLVMWDGLGSEKENSPRITQRLMRGEFFFHMYTTVSVVCNDTINSVLYLSMF